jgi:mRNA-degrading endonuclease toxin of MazEF toxin-antitoxin module
LNCFDAMASAAAASIIGSRTQKPANHVRAANADEHQRVAAPVTSTIRGVPSQGVLNEEDGMKSPCAVNLHNAVTVSQQRLGKRVAQLSSARMNEVCAALRFSLGCDAN